MAKVYDEPTTIQPRWKTAITSLSSAALYICSFWVGTNATTPLEELSPWVQPIAGVLVAIAVFLVVAMFVFRKTDRLFSDKAFFAFIFVLITYSLGLGYGLFF